MEPTNSTARELSLLEGLRAVPPRVARRHGVVPLRYEADRLIVGARDPHNLNARDTLRRLGHADAVFEPITEEHFSEVMEKWYGPVGEVAEFAARLPRLAPEDPSLSHGQQVDEAPAARFLRLTLEAAVAEGASDVHFEPDSEWPRVRFRVDGMLVDRVAPPAWLTARVLGRIKAMAGLALGECLFAQDGQFMFHAGTERAALAVRVSILPSDRGECAVLRLLSVEDEVPSLTDLGVPEKERRILTRAALASEGLIVFAGPTGSGKTTTLHALLASVDAGRRNIVSIEEPVEIRSRRIRQIPVRREVGLDFAGALRVVLRQDPDVILVGETRDAETAQLVVQAALAGHLVLTTVHAGSALMIFERFAQLGAERALLAQVVRLTVSQRLLRRVCPHCRGAACFTCEGSGLLGRTGIFELAQVDEALATAVRDGATPGRLLETARAGGFESLAQNARRLVDGGVTTAAEVERVLDSESGGGG